MTSICRIEDLHLSYHDGEREHHVLQGVNADIHAGEFIALYGRSGCGKSSLLNAIAGLEDFQSGAIYHSKDSKAGSQAITSLHQLSDDQVCRLRSHQLGMVYQSFNLIPTLSVAEQLRLRLELVHQSGAGEEKDKETDKVEQLISAVGLSGREHSYPDQLSGGEQQRVAIAAALVHQPQMVLADEPTGNLDHEQAERILSLLIALCRDRGGALLMATHDRQIADRADRVWYMSEGQIKETVNSNTFCWWRGFCCT